ncbi:bifunctional cobalt-precorrin-7 (C(5))-methyltransferase/cobalt-precorrin-6B (C(15))-methyltransferase [Corynebacterium vitaeruminis]|uniref:Precorrin-6Y C5,15-methyltransferase/precorrin-8W decarboxylase n=1 Tax=Corynebacterium vitaeruminis DSM 20294 TaxID=1224164 RepID=W5Y1G7_9CORY|nr:bifunctional cobalt-precorrin-7 (C(5))-methyltransferase/cobalt-precorrin-6B (C(15))-methyltransferase [Corynebacterium vitaeruminis]AHI22784.1 precorrin-6Y C5,15-methyltransferase/precorrin- 8W decarboxylase [Corynebacterium vitaeruminis DSM 20294]
MTPPLSSTAALRTVDGHDAAHDEFVAVVGIAAGGFADLGRAAQQRIVKAEVIVGSWRQLGLLPDDIVGERRPWPSPLVPAIKPLFEECADKRVVVLASGDPMFHGIGTTLARVMPELEFEVYPAPSSASLACARLHWPLDRTPVYSIVTHDVASLHTAVDSGECFLVLGRNEHSPAEVCELLARRGNEKARVWVLSDLGGPDETIGEGTAGNPPEVHSSLNVIAVSPVQPGQSLVPGLADDNYITDGQLTKQHVRALSVAALRPRNTDTLWDIGGGSGSIAIEFLRATTNSRAICFESNAARQQTIFDNARNLGVLHRIAVQQGAPESFGDVPDTPDVIFIGGGLTHEGVFDQAWERLKPGGRLVANAVTLESEQMLMELWRTHGGQLARFEISAEHAIGRFHALKPALPVTQWTVTKPR